MHPGSSPHLSLHGVSSHQIPRIHRPAHPYPPACSWGLTTALSNHLPEALPPSFPQENSAPLRVGLTSGVGAAATAVLKHLHCSLNSSGGGTEAPSSRPCLSLNLSLRPGPCSRKREARSQQDAPLLGPVNVSSHSRRHHSLLPSQPGPRGLWISGACPVFPRPASSPVFSGSPCLTCSFHVGVPLQPPGGPLPLAVPCLQAIGAV